MQVISTCLAYLIGRVLILDKKKPALMPAFKSNKNYLAGADAAEASAAPVEAAASAGAAIGAAGVSIAAGAGASTAGVGAATGASSFLPQAAKTIAISDTSRNDFFMLVLSNK
jgi:hypothetical protein